jgi:tetratricopeptide (TPR) repeat protein
MSRAPSALFLSALVLTGCALGPARDAPAPVEDRAEQPQAAGAAPGARPSEGLIIHRQPGSAGALPQPTPLPPPSPAAELLLAEASDALSADDPERAAALIERALSITPRDGRLWLRLATVRFGQRRHAESVELAQRALTYAGDDADLRSQCQALIARANAEVR